MSLHEHEPAFRLEDLTRPASRRRRRWPVVALAGAGALVIVVAAYLLLRGGPADDPLSRARLIEACHTAAQRQITTPATATFSDETTSSVSATRSKVDGMVDAQNSLGALIRNRYTCEADRGPTGWTVADVVFAKW